jgi:hypothetical protein
VPAQNAGDGALLGQQQPPGRVAAFVDLGRHDPPIGPADHVHAGQLPPVGAEGHEQVAVVGEERVRSLLEVVDRSAGRKLAGQLLQHLAAAEGRRRLGQLLLDDQAVPQPGELGLLPTRPGRAAAHASPVGRRLLVPTARLHQLLGVTHEHGDAVTDDGRGETGVGGGR